jgi:hypothetical protein
MLRWRAPERDEVIIIKDLNDHPLQLGGGKPGSKVELLLRRRVENGRVIESDAAPPEPPGAPLVIDPTWTQMPDGPSLAGFYPERSQRMGVQGFAVIDCQVGMAGDLVHCWISGEDPTDSEFGWSLLNLSTVVKLQPTDAQGASLVGRPIRIGGKFGKIEGRGWNFAVNLVVVNKR